MTADPIRLARNSRVRPKAEAGKSNSAIKILRIVRGLTRVQNSRVDLIKERHQPLKGYRWPALRRETCNLFEGRTKRRGSRDGRGVSAFS